MANEWFEEKMSTEEIKLTDCLTVHIM
jgi:hypothetical protein